MTRRNGLSQHTYREQQTVEGRRVGLFANSAGMGVTWACVLASLIAGLYGPTTIIELLLILGALIAIVGFAAKDFRMRALDWAALLVAAYEIPSLLFSQYRANGIRASWVIVISVLVFYAVRLTIRDPLQIAVLNGLFGLGGAWMGFSGLRQFGAQAKVLQDVGFTDLVAFRARLMSPPAPCIPGEWFTVLLLAFPFACALSAHLWRTGRKWFAAFSLAAPLLIGAALSLSLSRAVFCSAIAFSLSCCAFMDWGPAVPARNGVPA
jgi:hypothetical protein